MRILLVENNSEWQDSIRRGLPGYQVDLAQSYEEALACLRSGRKYVLSIVDLHLNDSEKYNPLDLLGGEVLEYLRNNYPLMRRIAVTGTPPSAVRQIFDQYDVDDLLLKENLTIADLRKAVRVAIARTSVDIPSDVKAQRSELWSDFRKWRDDWVQWQEQQARALRDHLSIAGLLREADQDAGRALAELESQKMVFDNECSSFEAMLSAITRGSDLPQVSRELDRLKRKFDTAARTTEP